MTGAPDGRDLRVGTAEGIQQARCTRRVLVALLRDEAGEARTQRRVEHGFLSGQPAGQRACRADVGHCVVTAAAVRQAATRRAAQAATVVDRQARPARTQPVAVAQRLGRLRGQPRDGNGPA